MRDLAEESEGECEEDGGEDWGEGLGAVAVVRLAGVFPVLGAALQRYQGYQFSKLTLYKPSSRTSQLGDRCCRSPACSRRRPRRRPAERRKDEHLEPEVCWTCLVPFLHAGFGIIGTLLHFDGVGGSHGKELALSVPAREGCGHCHQAGQEQGDGEGSHPDKCFQQYTSLDVSVTVVDFSLTPAVMMMMSSIVVSIV